MLNTSIDERVTLLELQMTEVQEEVTDLQDEFIILFDDVSTLFDGQALQDERILILEQDTSGKFKFWYNLIMIHI